jgi:hypothetical protein
VYHGPAAIIASDSNVGDSAKREFDDIEYESQVSQQSKHVAVIDFIDHLHHKDEQFTFQCQQVIEIDDDGKITRIQHVDLPGQREALTEFLERME